MELTVIAIDIAKKVFQLHWVEAGTWKHRATQAQASANAAVVCQSTAARS